MDGYRDIDRDMLLEAFDRLGMVAAAEGTMIDIVVYGGSALMFASNFRFATGDVDIAPLGEDNRIGLMPPSRKLLPNLASGKVKTG